MAGLPSSTPVQTPPLFRKNSSSASTNPRLPPSLFRSPSSPTFSPLAYTRTNNNNNMNANDKNDNTKGDASTNSKDENDNNANTDLIRAKSEEQVMEIKRKNRRAKIDNFETIPILHQYSSSPALTTPSTNSPDEPSPSDQTTKTVEVAELALASFGVSAEVEEKSVPWYLQFQVNSSNNLDAPKAEQ